MKTTTLIDRYKEENTESESQIEVDNGVHPLHWATSPSPSPMGTDPINGLKMVQNGSGNKFSNCRNRMLDRNSKVFKTPLCVITIWSSKDKDPKCNREYSRL